MAGYSGMCREASRLSKVSRVRRTNRACGICRTFNAVIACRWRRVPPKSCWNSKGSKIEVGLEENETVASVHAARGDGREF